MVQFITSLHMHICIPMVCVKYLYVHVHVKDLYVHVHAKSAANEEVLALCNVRINFLGCHTLTTCDILNFT